ncbi:hypothetical protein PF010_g15091 [Phytophthora fragariae]|uniref:Uncharacterized protein n=1 Tax=Phytophthora fragariae TaxID=53985 RepID=A0A6A3TGD1_9STRA|nr:hypothetical protein PF009_g16776 [Phytophthora fragariae]KAE9099723.1 hypothetical protein PF010_g15091 [Phytophthora fragariae]KAE9100277.1 hypothetical protein PF007_g15580 [Phytophthora fragariae]KAE9135571.1 hypothetical protein PF006_g14576 [Phytophthora fragariae]KAE9189870.1 hypothetical protein PF004_g22073 [Phytophthora fragariae]
MSGSVIYSAIDLTDGLYQILMRESDIPLTAVSTPQWYALGVARDAAGFEECAGHLQQDGLLCVAPASCFAASYFDDIFVHSRAEDGLNAVDVHPQHLRKVLEKMRENKLYANL